MGLGAAPVLNTTNSRSVALSTDVISPGRGNCKKPMELPKVASVPTNITEQ